MPMISFAWTTGALLAGKKTATRRDWTDDYARQFITAYHAGQLVDAYNKSPRSGGKKVALIKMTQAPFQQPLFMIKAADLVEEGGMWESVEDFISMYIDGNYEHHYDTFKTELTRESTVWVVKFKVAEIVQQQGSLI